MFILEGITRRYQAAEVETRALDEVSLRVAPGDFLAVMGPSGCGKSTLLNILGMLDGPDDGKYLFNGVDVARYSEAQLTKIRREHIAFIFQNFNLIDDLSVAQNIEVALLYRRLSIQERRSRVNVTLERVGLAHRATYSPRQLSGGQQQRVAIARAIVGSPALILADEPTGNLDSASGESIMVLLSELVQQGTTLIMATHSRVHAAAAHRIVKMLDGRIISDSEIGR